MNSNDPELKASEWLARLDRADPSQEDLEQFAVWKSEDPRHGAAYARLAATWQALNRVQALKPSGDLPIDDDYFAALQRTAASSFEAPPADYCIAATSEDSDPVVSAQGSTSDTSLELPSSEVSSPITREHSAFRASRRPRIFPWISLGFAASMAAAFAIYVVEFQDHAKTYTTGIGGFQHIVLEDQSSIDLNTDTEVRVALSRELRKVELVRGEASFSVAHDTSRPFIVSAGNTAVRAVGTRFDVHKLERSVEVTVDEGRVAVGEMQLLTAKIETVPPSIPQVSAGQTATASGEGVKLKTIPKNELARKLSWQNQTLVFDSDTLESVVAQFNRYNTRQLIIADPKIASFRIGGYFKPTNLDAFIGVLQSDFGIEAQVEGNQLKLSAARTNSPR